MSLRRLVLEICDRNADKVALEKHVNNIKISVEKSGCTLTCAYHKNHSNELHFLQDSVVKMVKTIY